MTASSRQLKNDGCPSRRSLKKIRVGLINRGARWAATERLDLVTLAGLKIIIVVSLI